jgi:hypothetical protein
MFVRYAMQQELLGRADRYRKDIVEVERYIAGPLLFILSGGFVACPMYNRSSYLVARSITWLVLQLCKIASNDR